MTLMSTFALSSAALYCAILYPVITRGLLLTDTLGALLVGERTSQEEALQCLSEKAGGHLGYQM